jgi:AcrR family transcriptional regulator
MPDIQTQTEAVDPRIRRTRQVLQEGLGKLMAEKDFDKISVQDIVDAAGLHRATFYDHYTDKYALLECLVGSRFHELLAKRGVKFSSCHGALKAMALGVCDYLASVPGAACGGHRRLESYMESAILAVVRRIILEGLQTHPPVGEISADLISADLISSTLSWAIYGAARHWVRTPDRCPAEAMADTIERLVAPLFLSAQTS